MHEPIQTKQSMFVTPDGRKVFGVFVLVTTLFALWGVCNGMIDVMDKHFQKELHLTLSQSASVQLAHYLGYFLMALPAGWLTTKLGYKGGIIAGLLLVSVGGFWFIPATHINTYLAFLLGVCIIAAGLTFLETVANPYTTVLGDQRYAATRINIAQSFNGVGVLCGPLIGGWFFYSKDAAGVSTGSANLWIPYAVIAAGVLVLAAIFAVTRLPDINTEDDYHIDDPGDTTHSHSIWAHRHFSMAVPAQFFYVAAQAGIWGFFVNYMTSQTPPIPASWNTGWLRHALETGPNGALILTDQGAASLASAALLCFLVGRFIGSALLKSFAAHRVLGWFAVINVVVCLGIVLRLGWVSVACVFLSYFFMSIMFPTIFALGIFGLGVRSKQASAFIVMAIVGGAIMPKLMGYIADHSNLSLGYLVPLGCFVFVAFYGFLWPRLSRMEGMVNVPVNAMH